ncbi:MAG: hypothetical protein WCF16_01260, partial [Alphaproteobacteria bacterium]
AVAVVAASRQALAQGSLVDLTGLEGEVSDICRQLTTMPAAEAARFKPPLVALADDLDRLTEDLARSHKALGEELGGVSARHKAAKAYAKGTP